MAIRSAQVLLLLAAAALVATVMVRLRLVVVPILIATLLAAAISPLVSLLVRRGLPRQLAVWVALIGGFAALAGVGWIVVAGIRAEWDELQSRASEI
jgi:predicted PurR-regulated permease PerM